MPDLSSSFALPSFSSRAVAGVVLAAGSSTRMGRNKMLLELDGEPLARRAARTALAAGLAPVFGVLGHEADLVEAALAGLPVVPVVNPDHASGQRTSLQAGIRAALSAGAAAAVVLLGDMPRVTAAMAAALVERWHATGAPLVLSRYGEAQAPPTLYAAAIFPELLALTEGCAKRVVRRHAGEETALGWPVEALDDVDVEADYARIVDAAGYTLPRSVGA